MTVVEIGDIGTNRMPPELARRVSRLLDHLQNGILDTDEIGNTIRDLVHLIRARQPAAPNETPEPKGKGRKAKRR